jgi:hypothetical protein
MLLIVTDIPNVKMCGSCFSRKTNCTDGVYSDSTKKILCFALKYAVTASWYAIIYSVSIWMDGKIEGWMDRWIDDWIAGYRQTNMLTSVMPRGVFLAWRIIGHFCLDLF